MRYAHLPPGTIQVKGESVCASLRGLPISPCFSLDKTGETSFRGAIYGMGFASCQFTRRYTHADLTEEQRSANAAPKRAHAAGSANASEPLNLRPSIAAEAP